MPANIDELMHFNHTMISSNDGDHFHTLGIEMLSMAPKQARMRMPYREELIGDPDTGVIHGGAITSLLDTCCGFAASTELEVLGFTPTIDLRIDYMRPATPGLEIIVDAEVYRSTEYVIFTRGIAHHGDRAQPIACAVGNFFRMKSQAFDEIHSLYRDASTGVSRNRVDENE